MAGKRKWLGITLKAGLSLGALAYVYFKLRSDADSLQDMWWSLGPGDWAYILVAILLLLPNIGLEAQKWRVMVRPFYPVLGMWTAFKAVLAGMAAGIFTPNRIGEYAGRVLYLDVGHRVEAIVATFVDRICQLLITILGGLLAFLALLSVTGATLTAQLSLQGWQLYLFLALVLLTATLILLFLFRPQRLNALVPKSWNRYNWVRKLRFATENLAWGNVRVVIGLALLRYLTFSTQYVLLLLAFGWDGPLLVAYGMVALVFLGKSVFPVMGIFELGIRESIAIEVMGIFGLGAAAAFNATLFLYLLNIILPTVIGVAALQGMRLQADEPEP